MLRSGFYQTKSQHRILVIRCEPIAHSGADFICRTAIAPATHDDPILLIVLKLERTARIKRRFRGSPFPDISDQILNPPAVAALWIISYPLLFEYAAFLRDRAARRPRITPGIQIFLVSITRGVLPFFFGRQTVSHAVPL